MLLRKCQRYIKDMLWVCCVYVMGMLRYFSVMLEIGWGCIGGIFCRYLRICWGYVGDILACQGHVLGMLVVLACIAFVVASLQLKPPGSTVITKSHWVIPENFVKYRRTNKQTLPLLGQVVIMLGVCKEYFRVTLGVCQRYVVGMFLACCWYVVGM